MSALTVPFAVVAAVAGGCAMIAALVTVVWLALRQRGQSSATPALSRSVIEIVCSVCQRQLAFNRIEIERLTATEMALTVSVYPEVRGRPLGEYACPYCEAAHCFTLDGTRPEWVGANLYRPQTKTGRCFECRKPLVAPAWPRGEFDGRIEEAPDLNPDYGLVCPFCKAICCVACCKDATRNRTKGGALLCPRCYRQPVDRVFHP